MPVGLVRKTAISEAVMISNPEEEEIVRGWLAESGYPDAENADLSDLIENHVWFMRDPGTSKSVYLIHPADYVDNFEDVEEAEDIDVFEKFRKDLGLEDEPTE